MLTSRYSYGGRQVSSRTNAKTVAHARLPLYVAWRALEHQRYLSSLPLSASPSREPPRLILDNALTPQGPPAGTETDRSPHTGYRQFEQEWHDARRDADGHPPLDSEGQCARDWTELGDVGQAPYVARAEVRRERSEHVRVALTAARKLKLAEWQRIRHSKKLDFPSSWNVADRPDYALTAREYFEKDFSTHHALDTMLDRAKDKEHRKAILSNAASQAWRTMSPKEKTPWEQARKDAVDRWNEWHHRRGYDPASRR